MEILSEKTEGFLENALYGDGGGHGHWPVILPWPVIGYEAGSGAGAEYGSGYGTGSGYGYGTECGSGSGCGSWFGPGSKYGEGDGTEDGYGYGFWAWSGIKEFNGYPVVNVDGIQTIIHHIHGNVAKGEILSSDLTTTPCFVVKQDGIFAHGETLREAMSALRDKLFDNMPEEDRIDAFVAEHDYNASYPCRDLYEWHHHLTGSCEMGRKQFAKEHGIDIENDSRTVKEFIALVKNAYGGEIIRKVEGKYLEKSSNWG